jgi:hypothetical protein
MQSTSDGARRSSDASGTLPCSVHGELRGLARFSGKCLPVTLLQDRNAVNKSLGTPESSRTHEEELLAARLIPPLHPVSHRLNLIYIHGSTCSRHLCWRFAHCCSPRARFPPRAHSRGRVSNRHRGTRLCVNKTSETAVSVVRSPPLGRTRLVPTSPRARSTTLSTPTRRP